MNCGPSRRPRHGKVDRLAEPVNSTHASDEQRELFPPSVGMLERGLEPIDDIIEGLNTKRAKIPNALHVSAHKSGGDPIVCWLVSDIGRSGIAHGQYRVGDGDDDGLVCEFVVHADEPPPWWST